MERKYPKWFDNENKSVFFVKQSKFEMCEIKFNFYCLLGLPERIPWVHVIEQCEVRWYTENDYKCYTKDAHGATQFKIDNLIHFISHNCIRCKTQQLTHPSQYHCSFVDFHSQRNENFTAHSMGRKHNYSCLVSLSALLLQIVKSSHRMDENVPHDLIIGFLFVFHSTNCCCATE